MRSQLNSPLINLKVGTNKYPCLNPTKAPAYNSYTYYPLEVVRAEGCDKFGDLQRLTLFLDKIQVYDAISQDWG